MEIVIIAVVLLFLIPTGYAAVIGAPIFITSRKRIKEIIDSAELKPGDLIYELGAGTGKMLMAFSERKDVKVIGFELSPIFYLISLVRIKLSRRKNVELYFKNFYSSDLSWANAIYCYLTPKAMEVLKDKFEKELKPGARIISFAFPIKNRSPYKIIKDGKLPNVYFYK